MRASRRALRLLMGSRLPPLDGALRVEGAHEEITIRRDEWGVPHVAAGSERDAWFGLGFCHGQDRAFQLEGILRIVRGTLAELIGADGLAVDRLSRRIGFRRSAEQQVAVVDADVRANAEAYVAGVNAGVGSQRRRPHEFVLLRARFTPWQVSDVLGLSKLMAFLLPANWDSELARLQVLRADGPEALRAIHAPYADWLPVTAPPGVAAGAAIDRLEEDLARFIAVTGISGGSNNWAVAPTRTATGRPLLANDPHLAPTVPPHFYLADLHCPEWHAVGASLVGSFGIFTGHNEHAAWGVTAGLVDTVDLCLEELGADGRSVRRGDEFVPCEVREETIQVRRGEPVTEQVLITPEGPVVGPAFGDDVGAVSMRATWLEARPIRGLLELVRLRSAEDFHTRLADFPSATQNVVFATTDGHIGWQLVGEPPLRRRGHGVLPMPAADPDVGWDDVVPFAEMPRALDPSTGWIATANNQPAPDGSGPFLSVDFVDGYRLARIGEVLDRRHDWDMDGMAALQLDVESLPWRQMRDTVLAAPATTTDARTALKTLTGWDGRLTPDSSGATVFELLLSEMISRVARAKAPHSADRVLGAGFTPLVTQSSLPARQVSHIVQLLREQPPGWLARPWPDVLADALDLTGRRLRQRLGPAPARWAWGDFRPLRLPHPLGRGRILGSVFNLESQPGRGDGNTVCQAAVSLIDPAVNSHYTPALRAIVDVGAWTNSRWALPGGQAGNPLSAHYDDQVRQWASGQGVHIPWTDEDVRASSRHTLRLGPALSHPAGPD